MRWFLVEMVALKGSGYLAMWIQFHASKLLNIYL